MRGGGLTDWGGGVLTDQGYKGVGGGGTLIKVIVIGEEQTAKTVIGEEQTAVHPETVCTPKTWI